MKVLVLANQFTWLRQVRVDLIDQIAVLGHEAILCAPFDGNEQFFKDKGFKCLDVRMQRHGTNPLSDSLLVFSYIKILRAIRPDVILGFSIKPNIYGGIASRILRIPFIPTVTGLGTGLQKEGLLSTIISKLYGVSFFKAHSVIFQNQHNYSFMLERGIIKRNHDYCVVQGSGVNLERFLISVYPEQENGIRFLFVGRIMQDKGIAEFLAAISRLEGKNVSADVVGAIEESCSEAIISQLNSSANIRYHGLVDDTRPFYINCHCTVLPSYHEGMANVLLEAAATGRPVIASRIPGCKETFEENVDLPPNPCTRPRVS